jgi:hypothetical protein
MLHLRETGGDAYRVLGRIPEGRNKLEYLSVDGEYHNGCSRSEMWGHGLE